MSLTIRRSIIASLILSTTTLLAMGPGDDEAQPAESTVVSASLDATFAAHGGLERYRAQRQMKYTMNGFPLSPQMARPNTSTVDLRDRRNRIDGDGFLVAFDGKVAWADPGPDAVGLSARFVTLGSFYFIGMPFVFADPGVVVTDAGTQTFEGASYQVYKIGFEHGTGYTSKDDYHVFIDPTTNRLALIHHSVTENPDVDRVTWVFDEWQEVDGLIIPAKMTFYPGWNPKDPGDGHAFTIDEVAFSTTRPEAHLFAPTDDAVIDDRPAVH